MAERWEALVELHLDSGIQRYSQTGINSASGYWEPRIDTIGTIERQISILPKDYRVSDVTIDFDDSDQAMSILRNAEPFRRRQLVIKLGRTDQSEADFLTISTGRVISWKSRRDKFTIKATDDPLELLDEAIKGARLSSYIFFDLPEETKEELVPVLIGDAESSTGAMPAYLINAADHTYVAARGSVVVEEVFLYGELLTANLYTVSVESYGGEDHTVIDFAADQRDPKLARQNEITWNGQGWQSGGDSIRNPVRQMEAFLEDQGFDLDSIAFDRVAAIQASRPIEGAIILTETRDTLRRFLVNAARSYNLTIFYNPEGQLSVTTPEPVRTNPPIAATLTESDIQRESFSVSSVREVASGARFQFSLNGVTGRLEKFGEIGNVVQENALGEKVELSYDLPFIRDGAYGSAVINDKLFFMQEDRVAAQMRLTDPGQIREINVGSVVRLSHYAGLGAEGYRSALFRTVSVGIDLNPKSFAMRLKLVDVIERSESYGKLFENMTFDRVPSTYTTLVPDDRVFLPLPESLLESEI